MPLTRYICFRRERSQSLKIFTSYKLGIEASHATRYIYYYYCENIMKKTKRANEHIALVVTINISKLRGSLTDCVQEKF